MGRARPGWCRVGDLLRAFATVFLAELPDKSMFATIVLVARYRHPLGVWLGAAAAFAIHVTVAVTAGQLIGLLPERVVQAAVAVLFGVGAVVLFRHARSSSAADEEDEAGPVPGATARQAAIGAFGLIALAEWGDLTQLATAGLAARSGAPVATGLGAWTAVVAVSALAATVGGQLVRRVPLHRLNYAAAAVFAGLCAWTVVDLLG